MHYGRGGGGLNIKSNKADHLCSFPEGRGIVIPPLTFTGRNACHTGDTGKKGKENSEPQREEEEKEEREGAERARE